MRYASPSLQAAAKVGADGASPSRRSGWHCCIIPSFFKKIITLFQRIFDMLRSVAIHGRWDFLTTNRTNFHKWGAASPEMFVFGLIRVDSENS
jgi:hypothetical protein